MQKGLATGFNNIEHGHFQPILLNSILQHLIFIRKSVHLITVYQKIRTNEISKDCTCSIHVLGCDNHKCQCFRRDDNVIFIRLIVQRRKWQPVVFEQLQN